nr:hypothetical protein [Endozoicomonas sp.]
IDRVPRMLTCVKAAIPLCDEVYLLDNSSTEKPLLTVAKIIGGIVTREAHMPDWADELLTR